MATILRRDRPRPWLVCYFDECGHRRSRSFHRHDLALRFKAEKELVVRRGISETITLHAAAIRFLEDKLASGGSRCTPERYHQALKQFVQVVGNPDLHRLSAADVEKYKLARQERVSNRTAWNNLKVIKTFFRWCVRRRLIAFSPADDVDLPKFKERIPEWPEDDEIETVLRAARSARGEFFRLILISAFAGLRRGEMLSLRREDCDLRNRIFRVQTTKSKHPRIVPMHDLVYEEIAGEVWQGWLFPSPDNPANHASFELTKHCCQWLHEAGFVWTLHSFRHSFASRVARVPGATLETLQSLMGHTSVRMALHYLHSRSEARAKLVGQLKSPDLKSDSGAVIEFRSGTAS